MLGDGFEIQNTDCEFGLSLLPDASVDSVVTDPPAGIAFMGAEWDEDKGGREQWVAWLSGVMRECLRVLKPGGHALVWALPRTSHWTATAIEDAGFELRDVITHHFGTGFPKSLDVSKAIDKRGGSAHLSGKIGEALRKARETRGLSIGHCDQRFCDGTSNWSWFEGRPRGQRPPTPETFARIVEEWPELQPLADAVAEVERDVIGTRKGTPWGFSGERSRGSFEDTAPATDAARQWQGYGTALKPASEHWILARKPLVGTVAANVLAHGCGALNIDGCRIATTDDLNGGAYAKGREPRAMTPGGVGQRETEVGREFAQPSGRWPANAIFSGDAVEELDQQSGIQKSGVAVQRNGGGQKIFGGIAGNENALGARADAGYGDTGGASRFFKVVQESDQEWLARNLLSLPADIAQSSFPLRRLLDAIAQNTAVTSALPEGLRLLSQTDCLTTTVTASESRSFATSVIGAIRNLGPAFLREWPREGLTLCDSPANVVGKREATGITRITANLLRSDGSVVPVTFAITPTSSEVGERAFEQCAEGSFKYCAKASKTDRGEGNDHPTVKAHELMRWLVRLVTPAGGTVLDPFTGSGSTGVACRVEGFRFIGFERDPHFFEIACRRVGA